MIHQANAGATPNIRLYEVLIGAGFSFLCTAIASIAVQLARGGVGAADSLISFAIFFIAYMAGVALRAWRIVGEREWSAWMLAARLTEFRHARKFPLVNFWLLHGRARGK